MVIFGLIIFVSGLLFYKAYPDRILFAYIGSIFMASSVAVMDACASVLTDPLFMLFVVLFLLAVRSFAENQKSIHLFWMGLITCLALLERYTGLVLLLTGALFLIYFYGKHYFQGLFKSALFSLSALPVVLWSIFHNYSVSKRPFAYNPAVNAAGNFYWTVVKILYWFFPYNIIQRITPFGLAIAIVLILVLLNRLPAWSRWFKKLIRRANSANVILILIYLGVLIFYTDYYATNSLGFQRYHIVLIPPLLIVLFAVYEELILPRFGTPMKVKDGILIAVFILWLIYPFLQIRAYEQEVWVNGEIANNSFNFVDIRESDFLKNVIALSVNQPVYSNYKSAAWLYLRRDIFSIPRVDPKSRQINSDSLTNFRNLIGSSGGGYLVWFKTINYRDNLPSLNQLNQAIKMKLIFTSDVGDIYYIASHTP